MKTTKKRLTREESQRQTRDRLIETAGQLFIANGYGAASIRDIASQAGYSQGAFYSNFATKEALLLALLQRHMQAEAGQLASLTQSDARTPKQVLAALETGGDAESGRGFGHAVGRVATSCAAQLAFAAEYNKIWRHHQAAIASALEALFDTWIKRRRQSRKLAAAFMAHGAWTGIAESHARR